jgi:hypothetical protein
VPSGAWVAEEYAKLPAYDRPTGEQPAGLFLCHQQDGRACAGWVAHGLAAIDAPPAAAERLIDKLTRRRAGREKGAA